ncbi:hypothetical protein OUZ56_013878 [Daphnia magna]|uniref:Uncharacterized protein n=1 Tax=Daphnia magna TaxID=35525 RepID=A0ABQ9Z770_9CRUS|nr:hypothetical protein OUZ56_013878 [Daphnia magna]
MAANFEEWSEFENLEEEEKEKEKKQSDGWIIIVDEATFHGLFPFEAQLEPIGLGQLHSLLCTVVRIAVYENALIISSRFVDEKAAHDIGWMIDDGSL